jgi:modulator of FtsH protease
MIPTALRTIVRLRTGVHYLAGSPFMGAMPVLGDRLSGSFTPSKRRQKQWSRRRPTAFTFFMGLMLTQLLAHVLSVANGGRLIMAAFGGTASFSARWRQSQQSLQRDFLAV